MKKNSYIMRLALLLAGACSLAACFEDEGNYDYTPLPTFYVDTTGVNTVMTVTQHATLSLPSHLVYSGDKSQLRYAWSIYEASSGQYDNPADTLCTTEDFSAPIAVTPGTYVLEFSAIRPDNYRTFLQYELHVESVVGAGELVLYERNGQVDIDIIKSKRLIGSIGQSNVLRNLYTSMNAGNPLRGRPVGLSVTNSFVSVFTETDGRRLYSDDLRPMYDFGGMFLTAPATQHVEGLFTATANDVIVNNGQVHVTLLQWSGNLPLYPTPKVLMNSSYEAAPYTAEASAGGMLAYDKSQGRFLYATMYSSEFEVCSAAGMSGLEKDLLAFQRGYTSTGTYFAYAYLEDRADGSRSVLIMTTGRNENMNSPVATISLAACPEIADAQFFTNNELSPVLHYATAKNVYRVPYDIATSAASPDALPSWTAPDGEEITLMRMTADTGIDIEDSPANKVLYVATWNGSEGKVYLLDANLTSGEVAAEPIEVFSGFGKIYDLKFKKQ